MDRGTLGRRAVVFGLPALAATLGGCTDTIGSTLPEVELPGLPGLRTGAGWDVPGFSAGEFRRAVTVLNVWAAWCPVCRGEHDQLKRLANDSRFRLLGLVFMDKPANAVAYLRGAGNPYAALAHDDGRLSRAVQQRGVPGSYVIDRTGKVLAAVRGGLMPDNIARELMPAVDQALRNA